jgi:hypothetical protein
LEPSTFNGLRQACNTGDAFTGVLLNRRKSGRVLLASEAIQYSRICIKFVTIIPMRKPMTMMMMMMLVVVMVMGELLEFEAPCFLDRTNPSDGIGCGNLA